MRKGLAITPPVLGRISIGKVVEKNGKRLPEKDDQLTITSQIQSRDGWLLHPLNEELRNGQDGKLRSIPIRLLFNEPDLNFRADYSLFNRTTGRPLCVGNGDTCKRQCEDGIKTLPCPSPDGCSLTQGNACKPYGRLNVVIGDDDPLGSFVFRTTGFISIRTLTARLQYFQPISGNRLACLPLELRLRGKSTRQSHGTPIFYVDITVCSGLNMEDALLKAKQLDETRQALALTKPPWITPHGRALTTARLKTVRKTPASSSRSSFPPLRPCTARQNSNRQRLQKHHWPKSWNPKPAGTLDPASSNRAPQPPRIRTGIPS